MIRAGLKLNSSPLMSYNTNSKSWTNLLVSVVYPSSDTQNVTNNPIILNDLIVDTLGFIWRVINSTHTGGTDFNLEVTLVNGIADENTIPNIGDTKASISSLVNNQLSAFWDATYIDSNIQKIISIYNTESTIKLANIQDVSASKPLNNDSLIFNSTLNKWESKAIPSLGPTGVVAGTYNSATTINPITINDNGLVVNISNPLELTPKFTNIIGLPNTLAGYNIKDGATLVNGKIPANQLAIGVPSKTTVLNGNQEWIPGVMVYKIECTDWASSKFILPTGWSVVKTNSDTALQITHNLSNTPVNWSGIQNNSTPKLSIIPTATRNMQIDSLNQVTIIQVGSLVAFTIYLTFN